MDGDDGDELGARVAAARLDIDPFVARTLAASAASRLFGAAPAVEVGRYRLDRVLGVGGGGTVFAARDPELAREVAIKLIAAAHPAQRERALGEAQTLARLAHPNIVTVYDVGVVEDRIYLAMELVAGESLRSFAARATPREVLRAFRQAGEGLAVAHAHGVIHGDFKPDNAVIGRDGRVRVIDFGLAGAIGADHGGGTPLYMAPELARGAAASPMIDQYAFGVALREALAAPPRWLAPILARATAADPAQRYADLAALLRALADDPARRWRRRTLLAAPVALVAVGFAVGRGADSAASGCDDVALSAWSPARAAAIASHLRALGTPFATSTAATAPQALERYAGAWRLQHDAACAARDTDLPAIADRRATCLARAHSRLDATVEVFEHVDPEHVPDAVRAASELPDVAVCGDATRLVDDVAPPSPAQAHAVAAAVAKLDRALTRVTAALPDALDTAAAVDTEARAIGYPPLVAAAALVHGRAFQELGRPRDSLPDLRRALEAAIAARADAIAVEAYARELLVHEASEYDAAMAGLRPIAALATRLGLRDRATVALLYNHAGVIEHAAGHPDAARATWQRALELARTVDGPGAIELAWVRINLAMVTADPEAQHALHAEALAVVNRRLGPDHPMTLDIEMSAAYAAPTADGARRLLRRPCTRLGTLHPNRGAVAVECAYELAILDLIAGAPDDARASFALAGSASFTGELDANRREIAAAYHDLLSGDRPAAAAQFTALAGRLAPSPATQWYDLLVIADVELGRAAVATAGQRTAAIDRAIQLLARAAAVQDLPAIARRLEWARAARSRGEVVTGPA